MNYIIHSLGVTSTSTYNTTAVPEHNEYFGMACPVCYKPIASPRGSTNPKYCPHDNSNWAEDYRDPLEVFEQDENDWDPGAPEGGVSVE